MSFRGNTHLELRAKAFDTDFHDVALLRVGWKNQAGPSRIRCAGRDLYHTHCSPFLRPIGRHFLAEIFVWIRHCRCSFR